MSNMKKWGTLAMAAALAVSSSSLTFADESAKIADGDVTLTIFCDFQNGARAYYTDLGENPVVQKIEAETGLNLEFIHAPAGDDGSFFQQMLATGDLPDLIYTNVFNNTYPGGVEGAMDDGILMDVTELVENGAPNFWTLCEESGDPEIDKKIRGDEGKIVKFGTIFLPPTDNNKIFNGLIVRQDWLDEYGLEAPVTLDEYTEVLRTFKENGVEVPLALCKFDMGQFYANNPIASAFGVSVQDFDVVDGTVKYSRTQDGYKEFLQVLKGWAEEGLIDTGFVSRTIDDSLALFENGTAGMCFAHTYNVKMAAVAGPAVDENFKLTAMVHPRVNADDELHLSKITASVNTWSWQVSADTEYPEECVKFVDYLMKPEVRLLTAWGTNEDVETYIENEDGTRQFSDFVTNNPDGLDYDTVRDLYMCEPFQIMYDEIMEAAQYSPAECHQSWEAWLTGNDNAYCLPTTLTLTVDESTEVASIKTKLANYSDEMVYNFIFGEEDLDAKWDEFVGQLKDLGCERAEEIYQIAYDRYATRGE